VWQIFQVGTGDVDRVVEALTVVMKTVVMKTVVMKTVVMKMVVMKREYGCDKDGI